MNSSTIDEDAGPTPPKPITLERLRGYDSWDHAPQPTDEGKRAVEDLFGFDHVVPPSKRTRVEPGEPAAAGPPTPKRAWADHGEPPAGGTEFAVVLYVCHLERGIFEEFKGSATCRLTGEHAEAAFKAYRTLFPKHYNFAAADGDKVNNDPILAPLLAQWFSRKEGEPSIWDTEMTLSDVNLDLTQPPARQLGFLLD